MPWELTSDRPLYIQLVEQLELRILSGVYPPGSWLPSVRDLAQDAAVNPNTMQRALAQLEEYGLIITHRTNGRSVTADLSKLMAAKDHLARMQVTVFLENMRRLGYGMYEAAAFVSELLEESKR